MARAKSHATTGRHNKCSSCGSLLLCFDNVQCLCCSKSKDFDVFMLAPLLLASYFCDTLRASSKTTSASRCRAAAVPGDDVAGAATLLRDDEKKINRHRVVKTRRIRRLIRLS